MKQPRTEKFDIEHFQNYVETYKERYPDKQNIMFLDMLYGVGLAVDQEKFKGANGFREFLKWLAEPGQFEEAKVRYQNALENLISPESAVLEWNTRLNDSFQIASFGEVIDYKPEDHKDDEHPEDEHDEGWLQNRNHGG